METKSTRRYQVWADGHVIALFRDYDRAVKHAQWAVLSGFDAADVFDSATGTVITCFEGV